MMIERVLVPELMDDPSLSPTDLARALRDLRRLNRLSLNARTLSDAVSAILDSGAAGKSPRIVDIGTGDGKEFCSIISNLRHRGFDARGIGIDMNPRSIEDANRAALAQKLPIEFLHDDALRGLERVEFDVALSSLFIHHLDTENVRRLLAAIRKHAKLGAVLCDLERSNAGLAAAALMTRLLSRSPVVRFDGPQSVRAAFTMREFQALVSAELPGGAVRRAFPFRLLCTWMKR